MDQDVQKDNVRTAVAGFWLQIPDKRLHAEDAKPSPIYDRLGAFVDDGSHVAYSNTSGFKMDDLLYG